MPPLNTILSRPIAKQPPPPPAVLRAGPFLGLRDSLDPMVSSDPQRAVVIENLYPLELNKPSTFVGRPGFTQAGAQGGAVGKLTGQLVYQFTKDDGTEFTCRIVGGQGIQTYNWATDTWTTVVTVANLATASITLSETAKCRAITFTNKMLVSDGINSAWTWDGTTGAGGLVSLTNAPVFYGKPTTYYAKAAGISATTRNVIDWSEEQDPTIGYEMPIYNDTWALIQSDPGQLFTLHGTNEALYYQRAHSTAAIYGAVTTEFKTDGTRAGVDESVGTVSPDGLAFKGSRGFFVDAKARPHIIQPGAGLKECWQDIHETLAGIDLSLLGTAITLYDERTQLILFCLPEVGQSIPSCIIAFNPVLDLPVAVWRGFTFQDIAVVKNGSGTPTLMHLSNDGYAYAHGLPDGSVWSDGLHSGAVAIRHTIDSAHMGTDVVGEKAFMRSDVLIRADANASSISASYETPYGTSVSQMASVSGGSSRWDIAVFDTDVFSANTVERHVPFGLNGTGRWIRLRLTHEVLGEAFGVESMAAFYKPVGDTPFAL